MGWLTPREVAKSHQAIFQGGPVAPQGPAAPWPARTGWLPGRGASIGVDEVARVAAPQPRR
jgi:hypothetical protein